MESGEKRGHEKMKQEFATRIENINQQMEDLKNNRLKQKNSWN